MHQRISRKILIYFFFITLLASINNKTIFNDNPFGLKNFYINGLDEIELISLNKKIDQLNKKNILLLDDKILRRIINDIVTVDKYHVFKNYPSSLKISVIKANFFAKLNINGESFLIGTNGKLKKNYSNQENLPFIFGSPSNQEILDFYKIIINSKFEFQDIKNLFFFKSGRWDIETLHGIILKLPVENVAKILDDEFLLNSHKNLKYNIIDLRVPNQIIFYDKQ